MAIFPGSAIPSAAAADYTIDQSLRFNKGDSPYLSKTLGTPTDGTRWTVSAWVKKTEVGNAVDTYQYVIGAGSNSNNRAFLRWDTTDHVDFQAKVGGYWTLGLAGAAQFRDPAAWFHILANFDSNAGTADVYVNGSKIVYDGTETRPSDGSTVQINTAVQHVIGADYAAGTYYWNNYIAEVHFIDGQQLTPSSFGEEDSTTGQWKPIEVTGMDYGVNGFYQKYNQTALAASFTDSAEDHSVTAVGNTHTDTSIKKIGTASAQFDGTGDYLLLPDSPDWALMANAGYTAEAWIYPTSVTGTRKIFAQAEDGSNDWQLYMSDDEIAVWASSGGSAGPRFSSSSSPITINTWQHVALVKDGDDYEIFVAGSSVATATSSVSDTLFADLRIGNDTSDQGFEGYIDEIRISNSARYTGTYTPSTTAFTADSNTLLLVNCDGANDGTTFSDSSGRPRNTITAEGHATNQRPQPHGITANANASMLGPKQGTSLITFDGTGDYLSASASSDFDVGTNFTAECWFMYGGDDEGGIMGNQGSSGYSGWFFRITNSTDKLDFNNYGSSGGAEAQVTSGTLGWSVGTWYHLAIVKDGNDYEIFRDGVSVATATDTSSLTSGGALFIGKDYASDETICKMDSIRISDSARYTAAFDPPTSAFTNDGNTKLLIQSGTDGSQTFTDSSSGSHSITANGDVRWFAPKFGAGAMAFDGTGDYLDVADSDDFDFGEDGEFCIEFWVKPENVSDWQTFVSSPNYYTSGYNGNWVIDMYLAEVRFVVYNGTGAVGALESGSDVLVADTWQHVLVSRDSSGDMKMFFDGAQVASSSTFDGEVIEDGKNGIWVGQTSSGAGPGNLNGYMDELRISRIPRHTSTFTPSTSEFTDDINTVLLIHADKKEGTGFQDKSTGLAISTVSRMKFDGTGDYLSVPDSSDWDVFGSTTGNYTVDFWVNHSEAFASGSEVYIGQYTSDDRWILRQDGSLGNIEIFTRWDGSTVFSGTASCFSDAGSWHHICLVRVADEVGVYVDGVQLLYHTFSQTTTVADQLEIGRQGNDDDYFTGYMDELRITASNPFSASPNIGKTDTITVPTSQYTADSDTKLLIHSDWEGGLGADSSGNYNTYTATNLVATDVVKDSPTNNFATLNPLIYSISASGATFSEGNLKASISDANYASVAAGTIYGSGKFYCEFYIGANTNTSGTGGYPVIGVISSDYSATTMDAAGHTSVDSYWYMKNGQKIGNAGSAASYGDTWTTGDIIGVALDLDNGGNLYFSKNGTWQDSGDPTSGGTATGAAFTGLSGTFTGLAQMFGAGSAQVVLGNFGSDSSFAGTVTAQGNGPDGTDFYYEPPTDYLALCTDSLPSPEIADPSAHFDTVLYTGTGASHTISSLGFQPDFTWHKSRSYGSSNALFNSIRGGNFTISTNSVAAEVGPYTDMITAFSSSGFTMGVDATQAWINQSGNTYVSWNWLGGGTAVSNTDGSITSSVSANPTAGFSVVQYTGNDTAGATYGHGLSQTPELLITWSYENAQHKYVWLDFMSDYQYVGIDRDVAMQTEGSQIWDVSGFNSSVIEIMDNYDVNDSGAGYTSYVFHSVEGYSKMGTYTGNNNSDGPFIYTGFRPAWVMVKSYSTGGTHYDWPIYDSARSTYNAVGNVLEANQNQAEITGTGRGLPIDLLSNGFKHRSSYAENNSTPSYIYLAFAETPFKTANAR